MKTLDFFVKQESPYGFITNHMAYANERRRHRTTNQATNAVHCTDMTEDGLLECNYMFGVVAKDRYGA